MGNRAILGFFVVFAILGILSFGLIVHEATHLVLSGDPKGVCFGICRPSNDPDGFAVGIAHHRGELTGEFFPSYFGTIAMLAGALVMLKSFKVLSE